MVAIDGTNQVDLSVLAAQFDANWRQK